MHQDPEKRRLATLDETPPNRPDGSMMRSTDSPGPMVAALAATTARLDPRKFQHPFVTATGERRAQVALKSLDTLWFNTGTLCNLTCRHCYIESSPRNDRLVYLSAAEVAEYLDEIKSLGLGTKLIAFTGGEPFMNPALLAMLDLALGRGFRALVLTNAMKPM